MPTTFELSKKDKRFLNKAIELTKKSTHPIHQLSAIVVRAGATVSVGVNSKVWGKCAERQAIRPNRDLNGTTIYVVRKTGGCSRPCQHCQELIRKAGIKEVIYTDLHGNIVSEKF